jgi:hypothetical protein
MFLLSIVPARAVPTCQICSHLPPPSASLASHTTLSTNQPYSNMQRDNGDPDNLSQSDEVDMEAAKTSESTHLSNFARQALLGSALDRSSLTRHELPVAQSRGFLRLLSARISADDIYTFLDDNRNLPLWIQEEETGWTVLHFAAEREDAKLVERLIQEGAVWNLGRFSHEHLRPHLSGTPLSPHVPSFHSHYYYINTPTLIPFNCPVERKTSRHPPSESGF